MRACSTCVFHRFCSILCSHLCLKLSLKHFMNEWQDHQCSIQIKGNSNSIRIYISIFDESFIENAIQCYFIYSFLWYWVYVNVWMLQYVCLCDSIWMIDRIVLFIWFNWRWLLSVAVPIHEGYPLVLSSISTKIPFYRPEISTNHHILIA